MAKKLVADELWEVIEPLLPEELPKPNGGRPRIDDRAALTGILFVLKSGILWEMLPKEMGCGSGMTSAGVGSRSGTRRAYGSDCELGQMGQLERVSHSRFANRGVGGGSRKGSG
jgi:transposase